jgi:hypothetical protein
MATDDPTRVRRWLGAYPHANFAVCTGERHIVVDADVRPERANGVQSLEYLEIDNGQRIPYSVVVLSGRKNGSRHIYFRTPEEFQFTSLNEFLPGVDLKAQRQYVVAPGSRHLSGGYYRFADDCRPDEQSTADLPDFLMAEIRAAAPAPGPNQQERTHPRLSMDPRLVWEHLPQPGELRPDRTVLGALLHDRIAGPLYRGVLRFPDDRSRNDMALADKLAFYTSHNFEQALGLFLGSGLYRDKFLRPVNRDWNYAAWTLRKAFLANPNNWMRKPRRSRATGAKKGRKPSPLSLAILSLHQNHPEWRPAQIAKQLDIESGSVRRVLHRHRNGRYLGSERSTMAATNTQTKGEPKNDGGLQESNEFESRHNQSKGVTVKVDGKSAGTTLKGSRSEARHSRRDISKVAIPKNQKR